MVGFVLLHAVAKPVQLVVDEVLRSGSEDPLNALGRIAFAAMPSQGLLLDATEDLINDLGSEFDHAECIRHRNGVLELVVDRALVAGKRIQGGDLDPLGGIN